MLVAVNPRSWIARTDYLDQEFERSFRWYAGQRAALIESLEALPPAGWLRSATVQGAGKPLERTVAFYANWLARHERAHLKQIESIARALRG